MQILFRKVCFWNFMGSTYLSYIWYYTLSHNRHSGTLVLAISLDTYLMMVSSCRCMCCAIDISVGTRHHMGRCSLYFDQLWISVMDYYEKFLWWGLKVTFIHGYSVCNELRRYTALEMSISFSCKVYELFSLVSLARFTVWGLNSLLLSRP